jgi:20S proteasome alpha/beta subunit
MVHRNVWLVFSGLEGDGKSILKQARNFAAEFNSKFGSFPTARTVACFIGEVQHSVTLTGGPILHHCMSGYHVSFVTDRRPYGVQVVTIGVDYDDSTYSMYLSDPSGLMLVYSK